VKANTQTSQKKTLISQTNYGTARRRRRTRDLRSIVAPT